MALDTFFCPRTHAPLTPSADGKVLTSPEGDNYPVIGGIPSLVSDDAAQEAVSADQEYYRKRAAEYDRGNDVMFRMLLCDEHASRTEITDLLELEPGARVLEIGCGTCRDTSYILRAGAAHVHASDLSLEMITLGRAHLQANHADLSRVTFLRADAMHLPFPDHHFDAVFHFGGLNLFGDVSGALREMMRVVRPGGRVVAGDEGVGPWLNDTDFARVLENSNPLFKHRAPIDRLPAAARNVSCHWVMNGSFYVLVFDVGLQEPQLDLDVEFPGWRGGSHRSRYYGKLEGVSPELRQHVIEAAAAADMSISAWLEQALRKAVKTRD